jgi:hypothetical protein
MIETMIGVYSVVGILFILEKDYNPTYNKNKQE